MTVATIFQRSDEIKSTSSPVTARAFLLACGVLSALLYVIMNVAVPMLSPGYSVTSQTISELSAIGSPVRAVWFWPGLAYTVLAIAFGWGVLQSASENRRLRAAGIALLFFGALGLLWPFAPMHTREVLASGDGTFSDQMHIALSIASVFAMTIAVLAAAPALGARFFIYSILTMLIVVGFGALTGLGAPKMSANLATPLLGVWERISIGAFLLWEVVLAASLLRAEYRAARISVNTHSQEFPTRVKQFA